MLEGNASAFVITMAIAVSADARPFEVRVRRPRRETELEFVAYVTFRDLSLASRISDAIATLKTPLEMGDIRHLHDVSFFSL
ncbi:unnamed protein product [Gongylonema pulchrum]|uniref:ACT domain-containing protein n=1 Tax=Gongylonema pulchrum TaxID=637853 RepID=A0A183EJM4_9BILA|nr:unnamed protein product [Gongylonema pulchrum]